jgi:hypothetical protein
MAHIATAAKATYSMQKPTVSLGRKQKHGGTQGERTTPRYILFLAQRRVCLIHVSPVFSFSILTHSCRLVLRRGSVDKYSWEGAHDAVVQRCPEV